MQPKFAAEAFAAHVALLASLAPVPCRDDLAVMAQTHLYRTGNAVEVGVHQGLFAQKNLHTWKGRYFLVDAWSIGSNTLNHSDYSRPNTDFDYVDTKLFRKAMERTQSFGSRVVVKRAFSTAAAAEFDDGFFDWIYIDALHTHDAVTADLRAWWPKLRVGGLMSGDDFAEQTQDVEYTSRARTLKHYGWDAKVLVDTQWGVVSAVQNFTRDQNAVLRVTYLADCYFAPAWYVVKPPVPPSVGASR